MSITERKRAGSVPAPHVAIEDAMVNVEAVLNMELGKNPEPMINPAALSMHYAADLDSGFADREAYTSSITAKFLEEASHQAKLRELLAEGKQYAVMLYTWRSCSLGIPQVPQLETLITTRVSPQSQVKSAGSQSNPSIYENTCDVLEPEVRKLRKLLQFQNEIIHQFFTDMKWLCQGKADFVSEDYLHTLGAFINMFATLDELKNIKASVKNDYSTYKRAASILKRITDAQEMQASEQLSMFLATNNSILTKVKAKLGEISGYEGLMCDIINNCVQMYENHTWLKPQEKLAIVKVIGFSLYLLDTDTCNINKLDGRKGKLNLSRIDKIFKQVEVVPLYGDMMIGPFKYIEKTPNYDPDKWPKCLSEEDGPQSELLPKQMAHLREEYNKLVCELTWQLKVKGQVEDINHKYQQKAGQKVARPVKDPLEHKVLYDLAHKALDKLSSWTAKVTELFSWKLLHPADPSRNRKCPKDAENYELATKYNYTSEEKFALIEIIAMIKSVQQMLLSMEQEFATSIQHHIYKELQDFVQIQLREPLRKALKQQKRDTVKNVLLAVRDICMDLVKEYKPSEDPLFTKKKKDAETGHKVSTSDKRVLPSTTQIYMLRTMLESLVEKGDKNTGRKSPRKDLDTQHVQMIESFLKTTFYWNYLINFNKSVHDCCDLSQLWYREFYLEMTKGQRIQFPIEMSMPWILTNHILETNHPMMVEYLLYPLDLYNDSGEWALRHFKKQFLYDEIEAEVNLCFDQFIYSLCEHIFQYYKWQAGNQMLDRSFRSHCQKHNFVLKDPPKARYTSLMKIQHFQLLGRSVNLKKLISQRMNEAILKALNIAIGRFECSDLTGIVELQGLIQCNRMAHHNLSQCLELADFDSLLAEANMSVTAPVSRITLYVFVEINSDFLPQYCYNAATNRFVRTVWSFADRSEREKPPKAAQYYLWGSKDLNNCYSTIYGRYGNFVGPPHFNALADLIGYQDMAFLLRELLKVMQNIIQDIVLPYVKTLSPVMPRRCKLPRYEYSSPGILEYFQAQLNDIMTYSDLQPKVFQVLREVGNAILFCICMENALNQKEVLEITDAALFHNIIPKPFISKKGKKKEEVEKALLQMLKEAELKHKNQHLLPVLDKYGTQDQRDIVKNMSLLTREKMCCGLSIFQTIMKKLQCFIGDPAWQGTIPANGVLDVVENLEFHRFWSALQFVLCIPARTTGEYTVEELFGEGLNWAGCTLITLLGQQRRFEVMDYCYHLMRVHRVDQKDQSCRGVPLKKMVDRIRKFQILNNQIFCALNKYISPVDCRDGFGANLEELPPPTLDTAAVELTANVPKGCRESLA